MAHIHTQKVPRAALAGAALLIVGTIALAAGAHHAHLSEPVAPVVVVASFDVRFEDRPGGALAVLDASTGREVSTVAPGTNGFVRGVLRGMFRGRKLESIGREGHFTLAREQGGRLTLTDPQSGRRVDLDSFGPTNSAAFATILDSGVAAR